MLSGPPDFVGLVDLLIPCNSSSTNGAVRYVWSESGILGSVFNHLSPISCVYSVGLLNIFLYSVSTSFLTSAGLFSIWNVLFPGFVLIIKFRLCWKDLLSLLFSILRMYWGFFLSSYIHTYIHTYIFYLVRHAPIWGTTSA